MPQRLDYATPSPAAFDWPFFIRLFFIGPFTGMCVACAQTIAALICWVRHGEPDFYFRGWSGVQLDFFTLTVGGAIVGFAYGVVLMVLESADWTTSPPVDCDPNCGRVCVRRGRGHRGVRVPAAGNRPYPPAAVDRRRIWIAGLRGDGPACPPITRSRKLIGLRPLYLPGAVSCRRDASKALHARGGGVGGAVRRRVRDVGAE